MKFPKFSKFSGEIQVIELLISYLKTPSFQKSTLTTLTKNRFFFFGRNFQIQFSFIFFHPLSKRPRFWIGNTINYLKTLLVFLKVDFGRLYRTCKKSPKNFKVRYLAGYGRFSQANLAYLTRYRDFKKSEDFFFSTFNFINLRF